MIKIAFFGLAGLAALTACHFAREERGCLRAAGWIVFINWALFAASWYPPIAPAFLLADLGMPAQPEEIWALVDFASLFAVMVVCRQCWWAPLLWSPYLICLCMHVVAWVNGLNYIDYNEVLDGALLVQLAVLFMMGGGDCADRVLGSRLFRSLVLSTRRSRRSPNEAAR